MKPLLSVKNLKVYLHTKGDLVKIVDGVDLSINRGETVGLVGETGAGKTVTAFAILGMNFLLGIPGLVLRIKDEKPVVLLSANSGFVCVGAKKEEEVDYSLSVEKSLDENQLL